MINKKQPKKMSNDCDRIWDDSQETKSDSSILLVKDSSVKLQNDSSPDTFKEPLDKKIIDIVTINHNAKFKVDKGDEHIKVKDVKSSLSNLKKRLKEGCSTFISAGAVCSVVDRVFNEEIGMGLIENDK